MILYANGSGSFHSRLFLLARRKFFFNRDIKCISCVRTHFWLIVMKKVSTMSHLICLSRSSCASHVLLDWSQCENDVLSYMFVWVLWAKWEFFLPFCEHSRVLMSAHSFALSLRRSAFTHFPYVILFDPVVTRYTRKAHSI